MNFVAVSLLRPLAVPGSARWSSKFSTGPLPVTIACTKNPSIANIANLPFLISFTCRITHSSFLLATLVVQHRTVSD